MNLSNFINSHNSIDTIEMNSPEICIADQKIVDCFDTVGRMRSSFAGVKDWPWIEDCFSDFSKHFLEKKSIEAWEKMGGIHDDDGHPYLKMSSPIVCDIVVQISDKHGGFLWQDTNGIFWALKLGEPRSRSSNRRFVFGISYASDTSSAETAANDRIEFQEQYKSESLSLDERGLAKSQLVRIGQRLRLSNRSEQILWSIHVAVLMQKSPIVILSDINLGRAIWGGNRTRWPQNWRRDLIECMRSLCLIRFETLELDSYGWQPRFGPFSVAVGSFEDLRVTNPRKDYCRRHCPDLGSEEKHHHFAVWIGSGFMGALQQCLKKNAETGNDYYDFHPIEIKKILAIKENRPKTRIRNIDIPSKLFGPAKWSDLSQSQCRIIDALMAEVTRTREKTRDDRAEIVRSGQVNGFRKTAMIKCPYLDPTQNYIAFCGNGIRKGMGYRVVGQRGTGWLLKCGYDVSRDHSRLRKAVRQFLAEIEGLSSKFHLIVCGTNPKSQNWFSLSMLQAIVRQRAGWNEVEQVQVRIYAPEDYLDIWREYFETNGNLSADHSGSNSNYESEDSVAELPLKLRLKVSGISQVELSEALEVSRSFITQVLNGKRSWPEELKRKAESIANNPGRSS